jgi:hypothetical protein
MDQEIRIGSTRVTAQPVVPKKGSSLVQQQSIPTRRGRPMRGGQYVKAARK